MKHERSHAPSALGAQTIGNVGLYYVCYRLSRLGWNVMPTARNAKGIDVVAYSQDAEQTRTLQVKALSKRNPVPLGNSLRRLMGDFVIVCTNVLTQSPKSYIMTPDEVRTRVHRGEKDGRISFWLQPKDYDLPEFEEAWTRIKTGA